MEKENRNILITCGILMLVVILCAGFILAASAGIFIISQRQSLTPTATEILPTPLPPTSSETDIDPAIANQMDLIQSQVISLRGLEPSMAIPRTLLSSDQLRQNVLDDFLNDYSPEDAEQDALVLSTLGLLPKDFDLIHFYTELYSEQIAGYYDDEVGAMFVVQGEGFGGNEKMTYAHEYVHVLQDQVFEFDEGLDYNDESCEADSERCAGIQALIEGDATLSEMQWFQKYGTQKDYEDIISFYENFSSPVYDSAPGYMQQDFMFPYDKGQAFVETLYGDGGFSAIDAAYSNVPLSTEQILHPEKYPGDKPIPVDLPDLSSALGVNWVEIERNVMGEWYTYLILAHGVDADIRLDDKTAKPATEGWGGDTYLVYQNEKSGEIVFVMVSVWDTPRDLDQFKKAFMDYGDLRWGDSLSSISSESTWQGNDLVSSISVSPNSATWIIAPSSDLLYLVTLALTEDTVR
ncbi:MAG: hypothetical protein MUO40_06835 [Anaerolineaceae bacterium]|nr:hypothetical protein [Anaerolineaceae bacterium]